MRGISKRIEEQIARFRAKGGFEKLDGAGEPLPDRPVETSDQAAQSAGYRIMADAGVLPPEFALKDALDAARKKYNSLADDSERKAQMAIIADLELRYSIAVDARRKFTK